MVRDSIEQNEGESLSQVIGEAVSSWILDPRTYAAILTLVALGWIKFSSRKILESKQHLYRNIVSLYHQHTSDLLTFRQEIDKLTRFIFESFIVGRISDEQFENLFERRDDLLERTKPPS